MKKRDFMKKILFAGSCSVDDGRSNTMCFGSSEVAGI